MLKMIKNPKIKTPEEIEKEYPKRMYILTDFTDINDIKGHLYAISPNKNKASPFVGSAIKTSRHRASA